MLILLYLLSIFNIVYKTKLKKDSIGIYQELDFKIHSFYI